MRDELLPCPFCGSAAESGNGFSPLELITWAWCSNNECLLHDNDIGFTPLSWNTRVSVTDALPETRKTL